MEFHAKIFNQLLEQALRNKIISLRYKDDRVSLVVKMLGVTVPVATMTAGDQRDKLTVIT